MKLNVNDKIDFKLKLKICNYSIVMLLILNGFCIIFVSDNLFEFFNKSWLLS